MGFRQHHRNTPTLSTLAVALLLAGCGGALPENAGPEQGARKDIVGTGKNLYSQHGEELVIRDFFQDRRNGFFLDVGCAWPVADSNTYYLESELGWTGIAVDALDDYAPRWLKRRRGSKFFQFVVTDRSGESMTFYRPRDRELLGISTLTPQAAPGAKKIDFEEIRVETITLNDLLGRNGVSRIDLLSMDIEGHEPPALAGFDVNRFQPKLVVIEAKAANRAPVIEYFTAHGYERIERYDEYDFVNYYFTPNGPR